MHLFYFSVRSRNINFHGIGDRHARDHGEKLRGEHLNRSSHPPSFVYIPTDALSFCQFPSKFLTAILHRGLRNDFFFHYVHLLSIFYLDFYFPFLFGLLFPFSIWTFLSLLYLDFYFPFLFGLFYPFSIWTFLSLLCLDFYFPFLFGL